MTTEFKQQVREAMLNARQNYGGSDTAFASTLGINKHSYSRIKNGMLDQVITDSAWIHISQLLQVSKKKVELVMARTSVYVEMEDQFHFCQTYSKSMMLVDDAGIGKSACGRHIIKGMKNAFYVDCSQAPTKVKLIRHIARTIGSDTTGQLDKVLQGIKDMLNYMEIPFIVLDEFGDLDYNAMLIIKELWNATEGRCGWFAMGAEGLRRKMERGISSKKIGYRELFRRFSEDFTQYSPVGRENRQQWYKQLYMSIVEVNIEDKTLARDIVKKCIAKMRSGNDMEKKTANKPGSIKREFTDGDYIPSLSVIETLITLSKAA